MKNIKLIRRKSIGVMNNYERIVVYIISVILFPLLSIRFLLEEKYFEFCIGSITSLIFLLFLIRDLTQLRRLKRFFKNGDYDFLKEVLFLLEKFEFLPELKGKAKLNFLKGRNKQYDDIDLAVDISNIKPNSEESKIYAKLITKLYDLCVGKQYKNWKVIDKTELLTFYVSLEVQYRFQISSPNGASSIDITFGKNK